MFMTIFRSIYAPFLGCLFIYLFLNFRHVCMQQSTQKPVFHHMNISSITKCTTRRKLFMIYESFCSHTRFVSLTSGNL